MNERLKQTEIQSLLDIKATIVDLNNSLLVLSHGLWAISSEMDSILMNETRFDVEMEHTNLDTTREERIPEQTPEPKGRGRPRKESPPEPLQAPVSPDVPDTLPPLPPLPPTPKKPSVMERLLGKEEEEKARLRKERMAKLRQELDELNKK
jgi:hypothetical protein